MAEIFSLNTTSWGGGRVMLKDLEPFHDLLTYCTTANRSAKEVLTFFTRRTLAPLGSTRGFLSILNGNAEILQVVMHVGIPDNLSKLYEKDIPINNNVPICNAIRFNSVEVVNTLPSWPAKYQTLSSLPYPLDDRSFVAFPIKISGVPSAAYGFFSKDVIRASAGLEDFVNISSSILSLMMLDKGLLNSLEPLSDNGVADYSRIFKLTERQRSVVEAIAAGKTNRQICTALGYSESTIKQETIRIYKLLKCGTREQVRFLYNNLVDQGYFLPKLSAINQ